jgi:hypothetical protein
VYEEGCTRLKPVVVEWVDATSNTNEGDISSIEHDLVTTYSVGWLVKKDRAGITLATDAHPAKDPEWKDKVRALHSIPKAWIVDVSYL